MVHDAAHVRNGTFGSGSGALADPDVQVYVAGMAPTAHDVNAGRPTVNADLKVVAHQLRQEFADQLEACDVDECLGRVAATFEDAKVRSFVPLLVRRYTREELQARLGTA